MRKKASLSHKGKKHSEETKKKIAEAHRGKKKHFSEEWRKKQSLAKKGRKLGEDTRKKLSLSKMGTRNPQYGRLGKQAAHWTRGRYKTAEGYVFVYVGPLHPRAINDKYITEHRRVMENHLGRYLTNVEVVHHIDGVRDNNIITNLMLFANQAEHRKHHDAVRRKRHES